MRERVKGGKVREREGEAEKRRGGGGEKRREEGEKCVDKRWER